MFRQREMEGKDMSLAFRLDTTEYAWWGNLVTWLSQGPTAPTDNSASASIFLGEAVREDQYNPDLQVVEYHSLRESILSVMGIITMVTFCFVVLLKLKPISNTTVADYHPSIPDFSNLGMDLLSCLEGILINKHHTS